MGGEDDTPGDLARDATGQVFTTLSYANGPGNTGASNQQPAGPKTFYHTPSSFEPVEGRPDLSHVDTEHPDYLQESLVPLKSESHGGEDVGIWARGPGSEAIRGTVEQNTIYHLIVQSTPRLRERLCALGTCDAHGVPVELPRTDAGSAHALPTCRKAWARTCIRPCRSRKTCSFSPASSATAPPSAGAASTT